MNKIFSDDSWEDYLYWQTQDKKNLKKVNQLIRDIERSPFDGIGKPEPLRNELSGKWSRRINEKDRIIYRVDDENLFIYSLKDHY
jgi:toxin YoeB